MRIWAEWPPSRWPLPRKRSEADTLATAESQFVRNYSRAMDSLTTSHSDAPHTFYVIACFRCVLLIFCSGSGGVWEGPSMPWARLLDQGVKAAQQ